MSWTPKRTNRSSRREFSKTLAMTVAGGVVASPALRAVSSRQLRIGCTGLIFRATPGAPENLEDALRHMSEVGFHSFETWGSVLMALDEKGTLPKMLERYDIPLRSAFMGVNVHDPAMLEESIARVVAWGKVTRKYGGTFAVVNAGGVKRDAFDFEAARKHIIAGLNEHGKALNDIGLGAGLHQHTGSAVDLEAEVYAVMEAVDSRYMKFAPDVGQLQKAGGDAAKIVRDFRSIVVHMHLKDYSGGEHYVGYQPLGLGKVDLESILNTVEETNPRANVMVELDGSPNQPHTPRETIEISKAFLQKLGYTFRR